MEHPPPCTPTFTTPGDTLTSDVKVTLLNEHHVPEVQVVPKGEDQIAAGPWMLLHLHLPAQGGGKRCKLLETSACLPGGH